jgi:hypothetical protein
VARAIAICSCPRLGFMDFMGHALMAFSQNGVGVNHAYGAYWSQALSEAMKQALPITDYVITTDYDSIFNAENVAYLLHLMEEHPEVDAICSMQQGRVVQFLFTPANGPEITREELAADLVPIATGNFGLSIFRSKSLAEVKKPWFFKKPSQNGDWEVGSDKIDEDMFFWYNFRDSGKVAMLAPRNVIGHLELMIKWPNQNLNPAYQTIKHYREKGVPDNAWS